MLAYRELEGESASYLDEIRKVPERARAATVLAAVDADGTPLGSVTYVAGPGTPYSEFDREGDAEFRMLSVAPWAQGRGVGRALVQAVIDRARRDGRAGIGIFTRPAMRTAHHLYESIGFARLPDDDWEFEPGEWLWAYRLAL